MLELSWIDSFPDQSLEEGRKVLDRLHWNIAIKRKDTTWYVHAGHKLLLKTDRKDCVDAFLYGMTLSYLVMPEKILHEFQSFADSQTK